LPGARAGQGRAKGSGPHGNLVPFSPQPGGSIGKKQEASISTPDVGGRDRAGHRGKGTGDHKKVSEGACLPVDSHQNFSRVSHKQTGGHGPSLSLRTFGCLAKTQRFGEGFSAVLAKNTVGPGPRGTGGGPLCVGLATARLYSGCVWVGQGEGSERTPREFNSSPGPTGLQPHRRGPNSGGTGPRARVGCESGGNPYPHGCLLLTNRVTGRGPPGVFRKPSQFPWFARRFALAGWNFPSRGGNGGSG